MKKIPFACILGSLAVAAWGFPPFSRPASAATCAPPIAVAVSVQGDVKVKHGNAGEWIPVRRKDAFCPGDILRVMERSRADLVLMNETTLRLDQTTEIAFTAPATKKDTWLDVLLGGAYFLSRTPRRFVVGTPFVNAGIEGTEFFVRVESDKTLVTVFEGRVAAANDRGSVTLDRGQSAEASAGQAPVLRTVARPRDAVQWTLYYPAVVAPREGAPQEWRERAAALLAVGRADEADAVIGEALKSAPGDADALSLQAVIAVARNEKETALDLAKKAVAANPRSAAARIALSYAQQADFDLEGALASVQAAVRSEPGNALARARLSELLLAFGRLDEALEEAQKASAQNPGIARTQTVLGFAYLAQVKTRDSRGAFERAIGLDQADPLPHLGMGLATIRDGDVTMGREEIAIAASLDPNNSLVRSYLGKAYYEEKRGKTASTQFAMAKELDPADPTPYFYDAILKQSLNRPVEALQDLQRSISLNDNRAVYRSRLLLDEDLAARSASLGTDLRRPGIPAAGPRGRVEVGQHRPGELLRAPVPGGLLRRAAPARDRPGKRAAAVAAAPADQRQPGAAQPRAEKPLHPGRSGAFVPVVQRVQPAVPAQPPRASGERRRRFAGHLRGRGGPVGTPEPVLVQPGPVPLPDRRLPGEQRPDAEYL